MVFSSRVRVKVRVRFSVWLVSDNANVFVLKNIRSHCLTAIVVLMKIMAPFCEKIKRVEFYYYCILQNVIFQLSR